MNSSIAIAAKCSHMNRFKCKLLAKEFCSSQLPVDKAFDNFFPAWSVELFQFSFKSDKRSRRTLKKCYGDIALRPFWCAHSRIRLPVCLSWWLWKIHLVLSEHDSMLWRYSPMPILACALWNSFANYSRTVWPIK